MKKIFLLTVLFFCSLLFVGCAQSPTSPNSNGWIRVTNNAFSSGGRYGLSGTVFGNSMWVIGGASSDSSASVTHFYSDVWSSINGANWTKVVADGSGPFGGRYGSQVLSYNGKMWLIGGNQSTVLKNDVWNSSDGVSWTQVLSATSSGSVSQFTPREDFGAVVFNNMMWVIGGWANGSQGDVWNSSDGVTWTRVSVGGFPNRQSFATVVFNNLIWIFDGSAGGLTPTSEFSDTWNSPDGLTWTQVTNYVAPGLIYFLQAVVNNNQVWKTGGYAVPYGSTNEIYNSSDGINWNFVNNPPYPARFYHLSLSFNNQVWIIGGMDNFLTRTYYNDVWRSP